MKAICTEQDIVIPATVSLTVKARVVVVKGPRGELKKDFKHVHMEITRATEQSLNVKVWHGGRKHIACIRTICSLIENMITGVTKGFEYKMRFVYAHFPINVNIEGGNLVEIRNFLGEKIVRKINMREGVSVSHSTAQKDEIILIGNDVQNVSQSAADIHTSVLVKNKDIRKFLDGLYVSEKSTILKD